MQLYTKTFPIFGDWFAGPSVVRTDNALVDIQPLRNLPKIPLGFDVFCQQFLSLAGD